MPTHWRIPAAALALALLACQVGGTPPPPVASATPAPLPTVALPRTPPPTITPLAVATSAPTATEAPALSSIGGWVWHDECEPGPEVGPGPSSAPAGCVTDAFGALRANGVREAHEAGLGGIVVRLGAGACPSVGLAESATAASGLSYIFDGLAAGTYCVSIDPLAEPNRERLLPGRWTAPGSAEGFLGQTVTLARGQSLLDISFGWDFERASGVQPGPGGCTLAAALVNAADVGAATVAAPGAMVVKSWRVANTGTCNWGGPGDAVQALALAGGTRLGAPDRIPLPGLVPAGTETNVTITLTAPALTGTYLSEWKLLAEPGTLFGVQPGSEPLTAHIVVEATASQLRPGAVFHAGRLSQPPAVDGDLSNWPGLPYGLADAAFRPENWTGPGDQSAQFALGWDDGYLYLAIRVFDDVYVQT